MWRAPIAGAASCVVVAAGMFAYGVYRLNESESTRRDGPVVAVLQRAYPIAINAGGANGAGESFERIHNVHVEATRALAGSGAELIVWPESMAIPYLNREFVAMDFQALTPRERRAVAATIGGSSAWAPENSDDVILNYLRRHRDGDDGTRAAAMELATLSRDLDAALLIGSCAMHPNPQPLDDRDLFIRRNSVLLFDRGPLSVGEYSKKHLVPFGEYVPFRHGWPWLHKFLRSFVPAEMPQLDPGRDETIFQLHVPRRMGVSPMQTLAEEQTSPSQSHVDETATSYTEHGRDAYATHGRDARATDTYRIAAPVCYEGVVARLCRSLVMGYGDKRADMIVNQSNDGWFVYRDGTDQWRGTTEQAQHLAQYVFRAVENRVPVVRAVNTGISAHVDSNGRIQAEIARDGNITMVTGTLVLDGQAGGDGRFLHGPRVRIDDRVSPYGRWGNIFPWVFLTAGLSLTVYLVAMAWKEKRAR